MVLFAKIFTLILVILTGGYLFLVQPNQAPQEVTIGGAFSLTDQNGKTVTNETLKGKPSLVYFGFTFCPDICPTGLLNIQQASKILGENAPQQVFISIDPERDTVAVMKEFASNFPHLIALTGSVEATKQAALAYKVYYEKSEQTKMDYMINHSSFIYLMDKDGKYLAHFPHNATPEALADGVKKALKL